jgi:hypothetical protein
VTKGDWFGSWIGAQALAELLNTDIEMLQEVIGSQDMKMCRVDDSGTEMMLVASRWLFGEEEALRRDMATLEGVLAQPHGED